MSLKQRVRAAAVARTPGMVAVRRSRVHGRGVFARRNIRKGTRIIEYLGERVSHHEADRRYEHKSANDSHTFLFIVDRRTVVDAGIDGNAARFINHSCEPNCESVTEQRRIFIEALRGIRPGEELTYDYRIGRDRSDPANIDEVYACRCGADNCRGSMLWPRRRGAKRASGAATGAVPKGRATSGRSSTQKRRGKQRKRARSSD